MMCLDVRTGLLRARVGAAACGAAAVLVIAFRKEDPAWRDRSLRPARMGDRYRQ